MANEQRSIVWTLPPIGPWSKRLATVVGTLWVAHLVLYFVVRPSGVETLPTVQYLALIPARALESGQLWRVLSYATLDLPNSFDGLWSVLFLWWFGTPIEQREGLRGIVIPWLVGALGGAAALMAVSRVSIEYRSSVAMGLLPVLSTALVVKWGFLFARQRVSLLGLAEMDGRILAAILATISAINALSGLRDRDANSVITLASLIATGVFSFAQSRSGTGGSPTGRKRRGSGSFTVIQGGKSREREPKKWLH